MRTFLIFATLFAVALARPDIGLKLRQQQQGYNYQSPGSSGGSSSGGFSSGGGSPNALLLREVAGGGVKGSLFQGISSYDAPLVSGNSYNGGGGGGGGGGGRDFGASNGGFGGGSNGGFGGGSNGGFGGGSNGGGSSFGGSNGGGSSFGGSNGGSNGGGSGGRFDSGSGSSGGFGGGSSGGFGGGSSGGFGGGSSGGFGGGSSGGFGGGSSGGDVTQGRSEVIDLTGGSSGGGVIYKPVIKQGEPLITKHFYVHEAPEEEENARVQERIINVRPQKNYKIIFIKAPTSGGAHGGSNAPVFPQSEEKTIVYVLSKKNEDHSEDGEYPTPPPAVTSKPEVFFVKYKTKQEADQAVSKIQESFQEGGPGYNSPASFAKSLGATGGASNSFSSGGAGSSGGSIRAGSDSSLDVRGQDDFGGSQSSFGGGDSGSDFGSSSSGLGGSDGFVTGSGFAGGDHSFIEQQMLEVPVDDSAFQQEYLPPGRKRNAQG